MVDSNLSRFYNIPNLDNAERQEEQDKEILKLKQMLEEEKNKHIRKDEQVNKLKEQVNGVENKYDLILDKIEGMLECPICLDIPRSGPVFNCPNGHLICSACYPNLINCPSCTSKMCDSKSLLAVELLENIPQKCIFEDKGCSERYTRGEMTKHWKGCDFRIVSCPSCSENVSLSKLLSHCQDDCQNFRSRHNLESWEEFQTFDYVHNLTKPSGTWKSLLFIGENSSTSCVLKVRQKNYLMEVVAFKIGNGVQDKAYIVVHNRNEQPNTKLRSASSLKYFGDLCSIEAKEEDHNSYGLIFNYKVLFTMFPANGQFAVSLKLEKNEETSMID